MTCQLHFRECYDQTVYFVLRLLAGYDVLDLDKRVCKALIDQLQRT